jgi:hypothetical protein
MTISPPELIKSSLISVNPTSFKLKANKSMIIFLLMIRFDKES